jgi:hypothetical protein
MKWKIFLITFIFFFQIAITTIRADVILGSGVNIKNGTIIKLSGLNCNATVKDNYIINKLEVYPSFFLMYVSNAPTFIYNLSYSFRDGIINVTCFNDSASEFKVNTSYFGNGIKIYGVYNGYLTYLEWFSDNKILFLTIDASFQSNSTTLVYWPYDLPPIILCVHCSISSFSFDSNSKILVLNATHSSPINWILQVQSLTTTTSIFSGGGITIVPTTSTSTSITTTTFSSTTTTTTPITTTTSLPTTTTLQERKEKEEKKSISIMIPLIIFVFSLLIILALILVRKKREEEKAFEELKEKWKENKKRLG